MCTVKFFLVFFLLFSFCGCQDQPRSTPVLQSSVVSRCEGEGFFGGCSEYSQSIVDGRLVGTYNTPVIAVVGETESLYTKGVSGCTGVALFVVNRGGEVLRWGLAHYNVSTNTIVDHLSKFVQRLDLREGEELVFRIISGEEEHSIFTEVAKKAVSYLLQYGAEGEVCLGPDAPYGGRVEVNASVGGATPVVMYFAPGERGSCQ